MILSHIRAAVTAELISVLYNLHPPRHHRKDAFFFRFQKSVIEKIEHVSFTKLEFSVLILHENKKNTSSDKRDSNIIVFPSREQEILSLSGLH